MKRRFKRMVRYLPTASFGGLTYTASSALNGAGNSNITVGSILKDFGSQPTEVASMSTTMWSREEAFHDNIIKGIHGTFPWAINFHVSGQTAATGIAGVTVRGSIFSAPLDPQADSAAPAAMTIGGASLSSILPDHTNVSSFWYLQSRIQGGARLYWQHVWFATIDLTNTTQLNSESFAPPTTRIALKPNKRLRWNEQLYFSLGYSIVNTNGYTGNSQSIVVPSLRVAATKVRARR